MRRENHLTFRSCPCRLQKEQLVLYVCAWAERGAGSTVEAWRKKNLERLLTHTRNTHEPKRMTRKRRQPERERERERRGGETAVQWRPGTVSTGDRPLVTAKNILLTIYVRCMFSIWGCEINVRGTF